MKTWGKSLLLLAAFLLAALSSVSAWPTLGSSGTEDSALLQAGLSATAEEALAQGQEATQEQTSAEAEQAQGTSEATSALLTEAPSTGQQEKSGLSAEEQAMLQLIQEDPESVKRLLRESLGDRDYRKIEAYIDIMIAEYNDACNRHDALAYEYNALAADHTKAIRKSDFGFILAPEAVYDITENQWGAGATLGFSYRNLILTTGVEKMFGEDIGWDEGYRVRLGAGIRL